MRAPRRVFLALILLAGLAPGLLWRSPLPPRDEAGHLSLTALDLPPQRRQGPFALTGAWELSSTDRRFGGYSALMIPQQGQFLAFSDQGYWARFGVPGAAPMPSRIGDLFPHLETFKNRRDVEAASRDPASGQVWIGLEGRNAVLRLSPDLAVEAGGPVRQMQGWPDNTGPETLVRLRDGRFVVLCECYKGLFDRSTHEGLVFPGDPAAGAPALRFTMAGPSGYRPTDAAELPDGRLLVLMRRVLWPLPARFSGKLVLLDLDGAREGETLTARDLADLAPPWPTDNYEGIALDSQPDGRITAWLISDGNSAVTQRNLLLRLDFSLGDLPSKQKARR